MLITLAALLTLIERFSSSLIDIYSRMIFPFGTQWKEYTISYRKLSIIIIQIIINNIINIDKKRCETSMYTQVNLFSFMDKNEGCPGSTTQSLKKCQKQNL